MNVVQQKTDLAHYMEQYFPMISIHNDKNITLSNKSGINSQDPQHKNGAYKRDYVSCLQHALEYDKFHRLKRILVLEDDVVPKVSPMNGMWLQSIDSVSHIIDSFNYYGKAYSLVKLFEPERYNDKSFCKNNIHIWIFK